LPHARDLPFSSWRVHAHHSRAHSGRSGGHGSVQRPGRPAYAGEVTGNGKSLKQDDGTLHGASICAFSGINDNITGDKDMPPDSDGFTRVQAWGQLDQDVRAFLSIIGLHPGDACPPGTEEP
jgi:hypothetical protein